MVLMVLLTMVMPTYILVFDLYLKLEKRIGGNRDFMTRKDKLINKVREVNDLSHDVQDAVELYCQTDKAANVLLGTEEGETHIYSMNHSDKDVMKEFLKKDIKGLIGKLEKELTSMKSIFYLYAVYGDEEAIKYNVDFDRMDNKIE